MQPGLIEECRKGDDEACRQHKVWEANRNQTGVAKKETESNESSLAEQKIKADIEETRREGKLPQERLAEQEKFAENALNALRCVNGSLPCNTALLEGYLKGLPIGWVEKALGAPGREQKTGLREFYYWTIRLDDDGRAHTYRLQLEYGGDCPRSIAGRSVACKFNFYG